jgi:hypothetical protein
VLLIDSSFATPASPALATEVVAWGAGGADKLPIVCCRSRAAARFRSSTNLRKYSFSSSSELKARIVFFAGPVPVSALGALLTGLPTQAASKDMTKTVAIAEKMKLVAEIANVRAGRKKLFMVSGVSSKFALIEQPVDERRGKNKLAGSKSVCLEAGYRPPSCGKNVYVYVADLSATNPNSGLISTVALAR